MRRAPCVGRHMTGLDTAMLKTRPEDASPARATVEVGAKPNWPPFSAGFPARRVGEVDLLDRMLCGLAPRLRKRPTDERDRERRARHHAEHGVRYRADTLDVQVRAEHGGEVVPNEVDLPPKNRAIQKKSLFS